MIDTSDDIRSAHWFRWHHGTTSDTKLRIVASKAKQPVAVVIAVWACLLEDASQSQPRGVCRSFNPEVVGFALDVTPCDVTAIVTAMQGLLLDGTTLIAWDKRQPKRERIDNSAERTRKYRENKRLRENSADNVTPPVTPCDATKRHVTPSDALEERRGDKSIPSPTSLRSVALSQKSKGTRIDQTWKPADELIAWAATELPGFDVQAESARFIDYWIAQPGQKGVKLDWQATWRNWMRRASAPRPGAAAPKYRNGFLQLIEEGKV